MHSVDFTLAITRNRFQRQFVNRIKSTAVMPERSITPGVGAAVRTGNLRRCDKHYIPASVWVKKRKRDRKDDAVEYFSSTALINNNGKTKEGKEL